MVKVNVCVEFEYTNYRLPVHILSFKKKKKKKNSDSLC